MITELNVDAEGGSEDHGAELPVSLQQSIGPSALSGGTAGIIRDDLNMFHWWISACPGSELHTEEEEEEE